MCRKHPANPGTGGKTELINPAERIIAEAQTKEKELLLEAKEESIRLRAQAENEAKEMRQEVLRLEQRVAQREENLDRKQESLDRRDGAMAERERKLEEARQILEELQGQRLVELERVAHLTQGEAKTVLMTEVEAMIAQFSMKFSTVAVSFEIPARLVSDSRAFAAPID